jgi:hypothetical protein
VSVEVPSMRPCCNSAGGALHLSFRTTILALMTMLPFLGLRSLEARSFFIYIKEMAVRRFAVVNPWIGKLSCFLPDNLENPEL